MDTVKFRIINTKEFSLEDAVLLRLKNIRGRNVPVSGNILQTKAEELAIELGYHDFLYSNG